MKVYDDRRDYSQIWNYYQLPSSNSHLVSFTYDSNLNQFQLADGEFGKKCLIKLLHKSNVGIITIKKVLESINLMLKDPTLYSTNKIIPGKRSPTVSQFGIWMAYLALNMFLIFMILMILESYYYDTVYLKHVAVVFLSLGFTIIIGIILSDGECKKNTIQVQSFPTVELIFKLESFLETLNRTFYDTGLQWKFNHVGNLIQLHDSFDDKSNQSI